MISDDDLPKFFSKVRDFAALSTEFEPLEAIQSAFVGQEYDPPLAARIMGMLRADCVDAADGRRWIMRQSPRDNILSEMRAAGRLHSDQNFASEDPVAVTMRTALLEDAAPVVARIEAALASSDTNLADLTELARAVELAGNTSADTYGRLPELRSTLNRAQGIRSDEVQLEQGYFGNDALRNRLGAWIDNPSDDSFARAIYIGGIPGVGKSFLLTKVVQEARARSAPIVLTLDFDRRGLDLIEPESLAMELSRQLGNELPDQAAEHGKLRARLSGEQAEELGRRQGTAPFALIEQIGKSVRNSGRSVLLVLDTLEVLASKGASHPQRLFEFLDDLIEGGVSPMAILAAGRGEAVASVSAKRIVRIEPLIGLPDHVARQLLAKLDAPAEAIERILHVAGGNPLLLRLSAKLASKSGADAVEFDRVAGDVPEIAGAYLYRAVLSRIDDARLRNIASLGLVLSRVNATIIKGVIAPALDLSLTHEDADMMLAELATHHWLVEPDTSDGWFRHRSDIRQVILPLLYADLRAEVAKVNEAAAKYLQSIDPAESAYHALQSLGPDKPAPSISSELADQFSEQMISELSETAANTVHLARGERSRTFNTNAKGAAVNASTIASASQATLLSDLRLMLEKGDLVEAQALFAAHLNRHSDPATPEGIAALCHLWLSGQWSTALKNFRRLERENFKAGKWEGADAIVQIVLLEMRAEFAFDALVAEFEHDEDALRRAQLAYRDAKGLRLYEGPLAFALLAERRPTTISGGWRDAIGASGTGLNDSSAEEFCVGDVSALRERYGIPLDRNITPGWEIAASLNPYAGRLAMLLNTQRSPRLTAYVQALRGSITAMLGSPFNADQGLAAGERLLSRAGEVVSHLGALGTTADWVSAFAFFNQVSHVPLLARRSEAWRRTAAGEWVYGATPPLGWIELNARADFGAQRWLDMLTDRPDAINEAARQLLYWIRPRYDKDQAKAGKVSMGIRAETRLVRAIHLARRAARKAKGDPARAALMTLMAHELGRSVAAPIAIIASRRTSHGSANHWFEQLVRSSKAELRNALSEE